MGNRRRGTGDVKRRATLFFVVMLMASAWAAGPGDGSLIAAKAPSVMFAPMLPVKVLPGKAAQVDLDFRVVPGFHINSSHPNDTLLVPTALKLDLPTDITLAKVNYPPGKDMTFEFLPGEKLNVYTGDFRITAQVRPLSTVSPGTYRVHAVLKYQACDNRQCYPPREVPADFDVKVQKPGSGVHAHAQNPGQSPHVHQ
jgi:hypothetical protein